MKTREELLYSLCVELSEQNPSSVTVEEVLDGVEITLPGDLKVWLRKKDTAAQQAQVPITVFVQNQSDEAWMELAVVSRENPYFAEWASLLDHYTLVMKLQREERKLQKLQFLATRYYRG